MPPKAKVHSSNMNILEILKERHRKTAPDPPALVPAIVIRLEGTRYWCNDGTHSVLCESGIAEQLREGDRVWIGRGKAVTVILGFQGRDKSF